MTQVARGLDPSGLLLLDVAVHGGVPESLAGADLQVQVWGEPRGAQTGWGGGNGASCLQGLAGRSSGPGLSASGTCSTP